MQFYLQMRETSDRTHHCSNQARFFIFEIKKKNCLRKNLSSFIVSLFGCSGFLQTQRYVKYEVLKKKET